jgi:dTDP-4-dehydrorhamnose reductase
LRNLRLYVFGSKGQVACSVREAARDHSDVVVCFGGRPDVDILRQDLVEKALQGFAPDIVINAAAYTAVDRAESEPELAFATNRDGARIVAQAAERMSVPILHLSTDYVFDGKKQSPYVETDATAPISIYGRSKLEGELAIAAASERHVVLRTAWVYSPFGSNFVRTMLRHASSHDKLTVVDDQIGCPTYAPDIAVAMLSIARTIAHSGWRQEFSGVTHLAGPDEVTWYDFARRVMRALEQIGDRSVPVEPILTAAYPTAAIRPANSRLCCDRLASIFDIRMPALEGSLKQCVARILATQQ